MAAIAQSPDSAGSENDPSGTWAWEQDFGDGPVQQILKLNANAKNRLFGTYIGKSGPHRISNGRLENGKFSFELELEYEGKPVHVACTGQAQGDELKAKCDITADGETNTHEIVAKRATRPVDVAGKWNVRVEAPDKVYEAVLDITAKKGKLSGTYVSEEAGQFELEDLKLEDNILSFSLSMDVEGNPLALQFKGKPRGNKMDGTVTYTYQGETGEVPLSATREPRAKKQGESARPRLQRAEAVIE
ncbi:MAG: hypothetical protein D6753_18365 [Planctomycetota bacterium]|nr:MAG: hypothetical protein D6753_18365 [Planctomycetota bacterium]